MGPRLTLNLTDPNATKLQHAQFADVIALFLQGELNATHRTLLPLMEQLPNDPAPLLLQATIDAIQEKPVRFHKRIVKLMEMTPTDTEFGQLVHMLGRACLGKGINQREQWQKFTHRSKDPFFHILGAVFSVLMWEGDYDALTTQIEQSLQQYPDEVLLSLIALEVFNVQGNVGKMEQLLSEGVQRFPSSTLLHLYRIKQLIHLEEYEMAKKESERLLSIDPGETQLHQLRAVALLHLGEEEAFQTQLATILGESLPEEGKAEVLHQLGLQVWDVGRVQEALDLTEICAARAAVANNYTQSTFCLWRAAFMSYWSGDIPTARKFIEQGRVHLKRPEIDGHHARASNANILYLEGLIAGTEGKQEVVKQIRARLEALPANLFGSFPMFKQHIIKRLEYNNLVHNGQPQTLEATLENFHPKESTNLGQVLLRGPEGCFADWMRVHLVKARPESTTLRTQTTEKLLSRNRCETSRDAFLRNTSLIEQANAEWTAKNLSAAKALLLQEEKEWPMADATLPPQRMASTLRRALGMSPKTRAILSKNLASPTNLPPGRSPCEETQDAHANPCQNGERAWCDEHNTQVACCAPGLYPTPKGNGICACPAGGSTEPEAVKNGCEQANPEKYKQSIQDYFAAPVEQITSCYQRALGNTVRLRGKVTVRFALGPEGQVLRSRIGSSSLPHPPTQQCVRREIQRHHWPSPPDGFVEISYPLEFEQTTDPTKSPEEP
jgi:tetratricopeptide (TPR) repeat protein